MRPQERGFIKWLVLAIIALALLKYFLDWSILDAAESAQGQSTIEYLEELWSYVAGPIIFIWSEILWPLIDLFWETFQAFIKWGQESARTPIAPIRY